MFLYGFLKWLLTLRLETTEVFEGQIGTGMMVNMVDVISVVAITIHLVEMIKPKVGDVQHPVRTEA